MKLALLGTLSAFLIACGSLPKNDQQQESYALNDTSDTAIGQGELEVRAREGISSEQSGMLLLADGVDAFVARAVIARVAERSLDVQYYHYHSDLTGKLLTAEIWRAAKRGVRVRLLLDDMDMAGKDENLAKLNAHENIEVRLFNPFIRGKNRTGQLLTRFGTVTRRAHNKAMIADNQIAIIGGRNIGDEYFGASQSVSFGDLDVAITQPGVREVSTAFDLYWNSPLSYPVETLVKQLPTDKELAEVTGEIEAFYAENEDSSYARALERSDFLRQAKAGNIEYDWGKVIVLYDDPEKISSDRDKTEFHLLPKLAPYINGVQKELLVISPYFVPGKEGVKFFAALETRGVEVKILTNSLSSNDVPIVHAGYAKYRESLLEAGVEIYEIDKTVFETDSKHNKSKKNREGISGSKASLHAKFFVIDRSSAFIGSLNFDPRSAIENTEIGAVIDSKALAEELANGFDTNILNIAFEVKLEDGDLVWYRHYRDGRIEIFTEEPHSSWWDRFSVGFMKWLPVESQI